MTGDDATLENGFLPTTPLGDNLLYDYICGEADAFAAVATAGGGRVAHHTDMGLRLCDLGSASPFGNAAHLTRPIHGSEATAAAVGAMREFFGSAPGGPFLVFAPWPGVDFSASGYHLVGHPPLMLRPSTFPDTVAATDLRVVEVRTADQLAHFEETIIEAYPAPELQPWKRAAFLTTGVLSTQWRFFVGYEGDRCVATAAAWLHDAVTIVEMVSARSECRGKGYGAVITSAATLAVPDRPAMLIASDLGRSIYTRLGYVPLLRFTLWIGTREERS